MSFDGTSGAGSSLQDLFGFLCGPAARGDYRYSPTEAEKAEATRAAMARAAGNAR